MEDILKAVKVKIEGQIAIATILFLAQKMTEEVLCLNLEGFDLYIHAPDVNGEITISIEYTEYSGGSITIGNIFDIRSL